MLVGTAKDAILSMYVTRNKIRDFDKTSEERKREDVNHIGIEIRDREEIKEESKESRDGKEFYVCCLDESEYINIFSQKTLLSKGKGGFHA